MHILKQYLCVALVLVSFSSTASVVAPNDVPYFSLRKDQTLYIYDKSSRDLIHQLAAYNEAVRAMYDQGYGWKLDEEMDLILTSPRQQIANAYATVSPNIKTVWFPSGAALSEEFADTSWLLLLNAHEVAHLYQLNAKGGFNLGLKKVFGNAFVLFPIIPLFIHPNFLTPTFIIEGNATFNESRLNLGGRLHSGEKRALVLAQIAAGDIDPTRLINDDFRFPFGEESYLQGAYFQAHLAAKYGVEKTNQFFVEQGKHYLWPWILNKTFRDHFGSSYPQEIREYVRNLEGLAKKQQQTPGEALKSTTFVGSLNHDAGSIFFVTNDAREPNLLHVFDKATRTFKTRQIDLLTGKVFWEGTTPLTAATDQNDLYRTEYSLYGENAKLNPRYRGQIVTDQRAGKTVSLDAGDSWLAPKLLLDGEPYDIANSHAVLDDSGNVYYFRQNGTERILYRNREPVTKFEGFYAKPMEVTADGSFYFIGSTDFGSTLYRLRGKEITRVLRSDRVIDARQLSNDEFLVVEVHNKGHDILLARAEVQAAAPAMYSYGFSNQSLIPAPAMTTETVATTEKPYNSIRELRYSALEFSTGFASVVGLAAGAAATFVDPLEFQSLTLAWAGAEFNDRQAQVTYRFTKYLPDFFARYTYEEDKWRSVNSVTQSIYDQEVAAGFSLPILRWRRWDASVGMAATYEKNEIHNSSQETQGLMSMFGLSYVIAPSLGFHPWRGFNLSYTNRLETESNAWTKKYNTSIIQTSYVHGLPKETYLTLAGTYAWAEVPDIEVSFDQANLTQDIRVPRLTSHNAEYLVKSAGSVRLEVTHVLTMPNYSARIPLGLNRIAPVMVGQGIFMNDDPRNVFPQNTFEWGWGADFEILLSHRLPVKLRILNAYDTRSPEDMQTEARLAYKVSF